LDKIGEALGVRAPNALALVRGGEELIVSGDRLVRRLWVRGEIK
jgi:hypothetical protein